MTKVLDDEAVALAFREAGEAVRSGDPETLAGRFSPKPVNATADSLPEDRHIPLHGLRSKRSA